MDKQNEMDVLPQADCMTLADIIKSQRLLLERLEAFDKGNAEELKLEASSDSEQRVNVRSVLDQPLERTESKSQISRRLSQIPAPSQIVRRLTKKSSLSRSIKEGFPRIGKQSHKRATVVQPQKGAHDCSIAMWDHEEGAGKRNFQRLVRKQQMKGAFVKKLAVLNEDQQQIEHAAKVTCHVRATNIGTVGDKRLMYFDEQEDTWKNVRGVLNPDGWLRRSWDIFIICLMLFDLLYIPATLGFHKFEEQVRKWERTDITLDFMFLLDIALNFRTGYRNHNGSMVTEPSRIARRYARGLLIPDILASIPFGLIALAPGIHLGGWAGPHFGFLKLPRLLRLSKVAKYLERFQYATVWRIFRLMCSVFIIAHWLACGWMLILTVQDQEPTDWTSDGSKLPIEPDSLWENYAYCLHTAMLLLLGDNVYPTTPAQRYYCAVALLIGACVVATIMGNVSLLIQNQHSLHAKFKTKMDCVNESMRALNFPRDMMMRVQQYYDYLWQKNRTLGDDWINNDLSVTLRTEVEVFLNRALLSKCTLFHRCSVNALLMIVDRLSTEVFLPGDNIIRDGDVGLEMYFLVKGKAIVVKFKKQLAELTNGQYFGERSLVNQAERRTCDVQASTYCDLRVLPRDKFVEVSHVYPELRRLIIQDRPSAYSRVSLCVAKNVSAPKKIPMNVLVQKSGKEKKDVTKESGKENKNVRAAFMDSNADLKLESICEFSNSQENGGSSGSNSPDEHAGDGKSSEELRKGQSVRRLTNL